MKQPERWVCSGCENIVASRPARIKGQCRRCSAKEGEKPFKKGKNLCLDCFNEEMKDWRATSATWQTKKKDPEFLSKRHTAVKKSVQRSPHAFVRYLTRMLTRGHRYTRINERSDKRKVNQACLDVQITPEFMMALWDSQKGKCALTGTPMTHKFNDISAASIDRKDSQLGYIPGNVQLVCQWVNKAKGNSPDLEFKRILARLTIDGGHFRMAEGYKLEGGEPVQTELDGLFRELLDWIMEKHWKVKVRAEVSRLCSDNTPSLKLLSFHDSMALDVDVVEGHIRCVEYWVGNDRDAEDGEEVLLRHPLESPTSIDELYVCVGSWLVDHGGVQS